MVTLLKDEFVYTTVGVRTTINGVKELYLRIFFRLSPTTSVGREPYGFTRIFEVLGLGGPNLVSRRFKPI